MVVVVDVVVVDVVVVDVVEGGLWVVVVAGDAVVVVDVEVGDVVVDVSGPDDVEVTGTDVVADSLTGSVVVVTPLLSPVESPVATQNPPADVVTVGDPFERYSNEAASARVSARSGEKRFADVPVVIASAASQFTALR